MRKTYFPFFLAGVLLLGGCGQTEQVEQEVSLRSVETMTVSASDISSHFTYSGKTAAIKEVSVVPTIPGKVTGRYYEVGDSVRQGALLFQVDSTDLSLSLKSLEASRVSAQLAYDNAKKNYDNNKILFEEGIIAQTEMDQLEYAYLSAEAALASIDVQMETVQKNIADCSVTAPISGVITSRGIEAGAMASQATPAYVIMDISTVRVAVGVSEQAVNEIKTGDDVSVLISAVSAEPLTGTVSSISPAAGQTGTYTVQIDVPNPDQTIKVGMLAEASFLEASSLDAIVLPRNAVLQKNEETYVYTVNQNIVKKTPVTVGIDTGDEIEITGGLEIGDAVVIQGQTFLTDGEEVTVLSDSTASTTPESAEGKEE